MTEVQILAGRQAEKLLAGPNVECPTGLRNRCILELLYRCGLRVGEVVTLRPGDVALERGEILAGRGEGGARERALPVDDDTLDWLRRWQQWRPESEWWICTLEGGQASTDYIRQMVKREAEQAGLDPSGVSPRMLRDTYAAELLQEGFDEPEVQLLLGLSRPDLLERYRHLATRNLAAKVRRRPKQARLAEGSGPDMGRVAAVLLELSEGKRRELAGLLLGEEVEV